MIDLLLESLQKNEIMSMVYTFSDTISKDIVKDIYNDDARLIYLFIHSQ